MTMLRLSPIEIAKRIGRGDLVVYVEEEYGFRSWYWFPNMSEKELEEHWKKCDIEKHFFNPSGLPGDMVPVPPEDFYDLSEEEIDVHCDTASHDPRSRMLLREEFHAASDERRQEMIEMYNEWHKEYFPNEFEWNQGWYSEDTWRAHVHMEDDSWLKKPGQKRFG